MLTDFLDYERKLCSRFLVPLLNSLGVDLDGKSVLDVGCGYGGVLAVLSEKFSLSDAFGIDVDAQMIQSGLDRNASGLRLETRDFFALDSQKYDMLQNIAHEDDIRRPNVLTECSALTYTLPHPRFCCRNNIRAPDGAGRSRPVARRECP